jgi:glycosyltransferase involved in cell wall biosynthesis
LKQLIRREGFRLLHAHTPRSALVGRVAAAWAGVPMVYHVHSPTARDTTHRWRNYASQAIEKLSLYRVQRLISVSRSLSRHMQMQGYSEKLISVVPNGVPKSDLLRDASRPTGDWRIGTVALFRPRKGLEVLLEAIAALRSQNVRVRLHAVGPFETPEYEATIHEQVRRLGLSEQIDWIGFTPDVAGELSRMDLFVLPSLFGEGLPMVVLEAMAAGVPVVGTRVEGVPEALDDGATGLIAAPADPHDLASCIRRIISGEVDWSILRQNALLAHSQRFSAEQMARGVAAVYDRELGVEGRESRVERRGSRDESLESGA